jgi:hypothetical protein
MKTTLEIPDDVFRLAKAQAAQRGVPLRQFVTEAVREKLLKPEEQAGKDKRWRELFGRLKDLRPETRRIAAIIESEFERIDPGEWT